MKFVFLLLAVSAVAAAATGLQFTENKENAERNVQLSSVADQHDELLQRFRRTRTHTREPTPEPLKPILKEKFKAKHVARASEMRFRGRVGSSAWETKMERFATSKARHGYRTTDQAIRKTLPDSLSIIEIRDKNDIKALRDDFANRAADDFVTDNSYKVHEFSKNDDGITYDFEKTDNVKLELGVDRNEEINHYAASVKCRDEGRRPQGRRQGRSVFRVGSQLCVRTWINPAPRDTSDSGDRGSSSSGSSSSSSSGSSSGTRPRRCPRGFRRVGQRCQRIRRQQG